MSSFREWLAGEPTPRKTPPTVICCPFEISLAKVSIHTEARRKTKRERSSLVGYETRDLREVVKLRHRSGLTAEVAYFTEVTNHTIGVGSLRYRKSGDDRAIVSINGQVVGECSFGKAVGDLATISYGKPHARRDGEQVPIGSVTIGPNSLTVVSRCKDIGNRGAVAAFFAGEDFEVWHEYRKGKRVVAQRTLKPQATVEFSNDLSPAEQLCIVADMNHRLIQERLAEAQSNTIYLPVPAPN